MHLIDSATVLESLGQALRLLAVAEVFVGLKTVSGVPTLAVGL